jgi:DUF4097 and DUF4098 domain-containing protein YvlB
MRSINHTLRLTTATLLALLLGGYLFSASAEAANDSGNISRVNGRIEVEADAQVGNVSSVNGSIHIADGGRADRVHTVNGSIRLDNNTRVAKADTVNGGIQVADDAEVTGALSTVNGGIRLQRDVRVNGSVSAVNGSIRLDSGTEVRGEVRNVNGPVRLQRSVVGENLLTSNGDVELRDGAVVHGDVIFRQHGGWFTRIFSGFRADPELSIDASSSVRGDIHLYREVDLRIDPAADVGEVIRHF